MSVGSSLDDWGSVTLTTAAQTDALLAAPDTAAPALSGIALEALLETDDLVLLSQTGVSFYTQPLNLSKIDELHDRSVELLTNTLGQQSEALEAAYQDALAQISLTLRRKDWGFSVSGGQIVFSQGMDPLTTSDSSELRSAFAAAGVAANAAAVAATTVHSIELKRESGSYSGHLGWGRYEVNQHNFGRIVNLRAYLTSLQPGGYYNQQMQEPSLGPYPVQWAGIAMLDQVGANAAELPAQ